MAADGRSVAVTVRWAALDAIDPDGARARCTPAERARADRRATPVLRRRALASLAARRLVVAEVLGADPSAVELLIATDGRRLAAGPSGQPVAISVSTCGAVGLVAAAPVGQLGADVEDFGRVDPTPAFVARVASPTERLELDRLDPGARAGALLRLWTRKEAYLKATGEGIGGGLGTVEVPLDPLCGGGWFDPRGDGVMWRCFGLVAPDEACTAALVIGGAGLDHDAAIELDVRAL